VARIIRAVVQRVTHAQTFDTADEAKAYILQRCAQGGSTGDFLGEVKVEASDDLPHPVRRSSAFGGASASNGMCWT
jgi:hypothetical protein